MKCECGRTIRNRGTYRTVCTRCHIDRRIYGRKCDECGNDFKSSSPNRPRNGVFCSPTCRREYRKKKSGAVCKWCGERFLKTRTSHIYCTPTCHVEWQRAQRTKCSWCGCKCRNPKQLESPHCNNECRFASVRLRKWIKIHQRSVRKAVRKVTTWAKVCRREAVKKTRKPKPKTWRQRCVTAKCMNEHRQSISRMQPMSPTRGLKDWSMAANSELKRLNRKRRKSEWSRKCQNVASHQRQRMRRIAVRLQQPG